MTAKNILSAHAPAPWSAHKTGTIGLPFRVYAADDTTICEVAAPTEEIGKEIADLIAAAPELLEAAKTKLAYCKKFEGCQDAALLEGEYCSDECAALATAIAKAEGRA